MGRMQHLRTRAEFERVRREGRSWTQRLLVLVACRSDSDMVRVGVAAGKRVGSAVVRSRAKRLMREAALKHYTAIAPGWDVLLIARGAIASVRMQDVAAELEMLLWQAGLLK